MGEVYGANSEKNRAQELSQDDDGSAVAAIGTKVTLGIEYHGELRDGKREGFGTQRWPNGCHYEGYFHNDVRHGQGKHWWANGEVYEGEYWNDKRHGYGTYKWPSGAVFTGQFRNDKKDGKGVFHSEHRETFEGTYQDGVRSGEGVQTYSGSRQDVGTWSGSRLVQLKFAIHEAAAPLQGGSRELHTPDLASRGDHLPKGPLETASQDFILAACSGNMAQLKSLASSGMVHIDVVDKLGYSALFAGALHSQVEVVQFLLNEGADVNRLATDTQYSPLSACCHLLYYPRVGHTKYHLHTLKGRPETSSTTEYTVLTEDMCSRTPSVLTPSSRATQWSTQDGGGRGGVSQCSAQLKRGRSLSCSSSDTDKGALLHSLAQQLGRAGVGKEGGRSRRSKRHSVGGMPAAQECWAAHDGTDPLSYQRAPLNRLQLPSLTHVAQSRGSLLTTSSSRQPAVTPLLVATQSVSSTGGTHPQWVESSCPRTTTCNPSLALTDLSMSHSHSDSKLISLESRPNLAKQKGSLFSADSGGLPLELALRSNARQVTTPISTLTTPTDPRWTKQVTRLNSSKVFCSNQFGTILSAAQSTDILICEGDSAGEGEGEEEEEEEDVVSYLTPVGTASPNPLQDNRSVETIIGALLSRGADPNITAQPLPPLHYAILGRDMVGVQKLIQKGASLDTCLPGDKGGYSPLHLAVELASVREIAIVEHLLESGACPNIPTNTLEEIYTMTTPTAVNCQDSPLGGWTALHIACCCGLNTDRAASAEIVSLLLKHGANPNQIAFGHSPLSLAIMHGLNEVVDLLLEHGADAGLPLGPGVGSALCAVGTHEALLHSSLSTALSMVSRLMSHGADLFQSVPLFRDRPGRGTVVDHTHQQLTRGSGIRDFPPNSSLLMSTNSGKTKMAALQLLTHHLVVTMREELHKSMCQQLGEKQRRQLAALKRQVHSLPLSSIVRATSRSTRSTSASCSMPIPVPHLNWEVKLPPNLQKCPLPSQKTTGSGRPLPTCRDTDGMCGEQSGREVVAKDLRNFCYECGRHACVHLAPCSACAVVHYCSKKCQKRSWNKGHCWECHYLCQSQRTTSKTKPIVSSACSRPSVVCTQSLRTKAKQTTVSVVRSLPWQQ